MLKLHPIQEEEIEGIVDDIECYGLYITSITITDPSSKQVRLNTNNEKVFIFSEIMMYPDNKEVVKTSIVDLVEALEMYSITDIISSYHSSISSFYTGLLGNESNELLAEYYFETYM